MELNEEAVSLLASILNVSSEKIKEYAEGEEAEKQLKELNANNLKKRFDEGHKKASKLTSKTYTDALKAEFDVDITGETPEDIARNFKEAISDRDADDISEETIKSHPAYKALQSEKTRVEQDKLKEVEKEVKKRVKETEEKFKSDLKAAKKLGIMSEAELEAERWLTESGAILHADPEKRKKQIKELAKKLESYDLEKDEDGGFLISKDGTPLTKDGHNAKLTDVFREYDYLYSFQEVKQRESTKLDPKNPGGGNKQFEHFKGVVPKDDKEMSDLRIKRVNREISPEAFKEVEAAYEATKTA